MAEPIQILNTREQLKKVRGGRDGLYPFLENSTWDMIHFFDDFLGDEIRGSGAAPGIYEIVTGDDGDFLILANQENGVGELRATASGVGVGDEYCGLSLPELGFTAVRNPVIAVRLNIDTATTAKIEIGFTDVTTDAGAVNDKGAESFNAADAVVWVMDTTDSSNWEGYGVDTGTGMTVVSPSGGISPTAGTFETLIVALRQAFDENHPTTTDVAVAKFLRLDSNGRKTFESPWQPSACTSTVALVPWIFVQERTGADRGIRLDYIDVRARRTED